MIKTVYLNDNTDKEIIDYLKEENINFSNYTKKLIRHDMNDDTNKEIINIIRRTIKEELKNIKVSNIDELEEEIEDKVVISAVNDLLFD